MVHNYSIFIDFNVYALRPCFSIFIGHNSISILQSIALAIETIVFIVRLGLPFKILVTIAIKSTYK